MGVPSWVIGVLLAFFGSCVSNLGVNLQKLTHNRLKQQQELTGVKAGSVYKQSLWLIGLACVVGGSIADLISFGFADMSLLAPLGAMTLVVNLFFAPCFLKEGLTKRDVICTLIIIAGTVISVAFGSKSDTTYSLNQLVKLYQAPLFISYACLFSVGLALIYLWFRGLKQRRKVCADTPMDARIEKLIFPFLAGSFGAHSVLFAKSSAEVFKMTFKGNNQFVYPGSYFFICLLVFFLLFQMHFLNMGLERCDALYVVPVYQVCWVIMGCLVGFVYFQDYKGMSALNLGMFFLGVIVTVAGVYILSQRYSPEHLDKQAAIGHRASTTRVSIGAVQAGAVLAHHVNAMGENVDAELTLAEQAENDFYARARAQTNQNQSQTQTPRSSLLGHQHTRYTRLSDADDTSRASLLENEYTSAASNATVTAYAARNSTVYKPLEDSPEDSPVHFEAEEETAYGYIAPMAIFSGISTMFGGPPSTHVRPRAHSQASAPEKMALDSVVVTNHTSPAQTSIVPVPQITPSPGMLAPTRGQANTTSNSTKTVRAASSTASSYAPDSIANVPVNIEVPAPTSTSDVNVTVSTSLPSASAEAIAEPIIVQPEITSDSEVPAAGSGKGSTEQEEEDIFPQSPSDLGPLPTTMLPQTIFDEVKEATSEPKPDVPAKELTEPESSDPPATSKTTGGGGKRKDKNRKR